MLTFSLVILHSIFLFISVCFVCVQTVPASPTVISYTSIWSLIGQPYAAFCSRVHSELRTRITLFWHDEFIYGRLCCKHNLFVPPLAWLLTCFHIAMLLFKISISLYLLWVLLLYMECFVFSIFLQSRVGTVFKNPQIPKTFHVMHWEINIL